jgi:hypothetical protein
MLLLAPLLAQIAPPVGADFSMWFWIPILSTALAILGVLTALVIGLWKAPADYRAEIIRALGYLFWVIGCLFWPFRRGGPPGSGSTAPTEPEESR